MLHHRPNTARRSLGLLPGLLCLLLPLIASAAAAEEFAPIPLVPAQGEHDIDCRCEYLEDPGGTLTIDELLAHPDAHAWQPADGEASSFGFTDSVYWFRLEVINPGPHESDYLLEVHYPLLDEVEFFLTRRAEVLDTLSLGDSQPFAERPYAYRNFLFKPRFPVNEPVTVFLRIKSDGSLLIPILLWHEKAFYKNEQRELVSHGLYFGVLITFALSNLLLFWFTRERAYFHYTLYLTSFGLFQASLLGLGYQYLWPNTPTLQHYSIPLFMLFALFAALRFADHFLQLKQNCPKGVYVLHGIALATPLLLIAMPILPYSVATQLTLLLTLFGSTMLLIASFIVWLRVRGEAGYFFFAWAIFLMTVIASTADKLGWYSMGDYADHGMQLGLLLQIGILTMAQARRMQSEKQQRIAMQRQTTLQLEELVKQRTEQLEQANRQLDAMSHTDGLTGLSNRRLFDEELERQFSAAMRNRTPISLAMVDIDHFKRINDDHGHLVGDDFLRLIAGVIAAEVKRPLDSACRYGGEEFTLILPDTPQEGARAIAEHLRRGVETLHHRVGAKRVPVTVSVGTATLTPAKGDHSEALVRLADEALYRAKAEGRNRVVSH